VVLECEGHGKGPLALGAWRPKNTRLTHILWCMSSAIYLRDKLVLESEGHGKGPLALGAWRPKNTRPTHSLWCIYNPFESLSAWYMCIDAPIFCWNHIVFRNLPTRQVGFGI
jgi:hypothetical protein